MTENANDKPADVAGSVASHCYVRVEVLLWTNNQHNELLCWRKECNLGRVPCVGEVLWIDGEEDFYVESVGFELITGAAEVTCIPTGRVIADEFMERRGFEAD